jgi:hypothetical protein
MDRAATKLLLESYRPQDAADPAFAEALREVAADPELAAWFEQMKDFDTAMVGKFQNLPVPPEIKAQILHAPRNVVLFRRESVVTWIGSIAAVILLGLVAWHFLVPPERPFSALEAQAISYTKGMPALQFVCFRADAVADWINHQPGAREIGLQLPPPDESMTLKMIGSSVVEWNGRPVVMVCLQNGKRMAMLYIMKEGDIPGLRDGATETIQKEDWVVRATKSKGEILLLATRGTPADLDFKMPLE